MKRRAQAAAGKKLTTKISKATLEKARHAARYFGAEAVANDDSFNSYRDDVASRYGYETWEALPRDLKRDGLQHYTEGRRIEKTGGSL